MNGTEAAKRSGYRGNANTLATVAKENLRKPHIREEIDARLATALAGAGVTVEGTLRRLTVIGDRAFRDGSYSAAVRCVELQGKYLKMWSDRIEHVQTVQNTSTQELVSLIKEISEAGGIDLTSAIVPN
jgi:phage terminase small subunit